MNPLKEVVHSRFWYDELTGSLYWNSSGKKAGTLKKSGYIQIKLDNKFYYAHRLIWLYKHSDWPTHEIDHINGDRADNRIENLRDVRHGDNLSNRHQKSSKNTNQYLGVRKRHSKFYARIVKNGVEYRSLPYDSELEAHLKYLELRKALL